MPEATNTSNTRRDFLAFTAGAVAAKTVLPLAAHAAPANPTIRHAHPDAELLRLGRLLNAACKKEQAAWNAAESENDDDGPNTIVANKMCRLTSEIVGQIEHTPAATLDGILVKMRAIDWCRSGDLVTVLDIDPHPDPASDMRVLAGMIHDLTQMAKVAV